MDVASGMMDLAAAPLIRTDGADGPVTRRRKRATVFLYAMVVIAGLLPWLLDGSPFAKAVGAGLIFPGGGFLAVGGWWLLAMPVCVFLFAVAFFSWFAAGLVIAPPLVWGAAAILAGFAAGDNVWPGAPWLLIAGVGAWQARVAMKRSSLKRVLLAQRDDRNSYLPVAIAQVINRAAPYTSPDECELNPDELAMSRTIYNRSLQAPGDFTGYDRIDQFQTSALRYQINALGYGLGQLQAQYLPNFHGYLSEAQRRLIDQYLQPPVWNYWRWENLWGNLRYAPDPVGPDNIMLTGYFGIQVALYMSATGDRRYAEPGSLTFRRNDKTAYPHDIHTINQSLTSNFKNSAFCLFPCEPNWMYAGCNYKGMFSLSIYDRLFGSRHMNEIRQTFLDQLDREFTTPNGGLVSLRSSLTGFTLPFPGGGGAGAVQIMNIIAPERAPLYWAMTRHDLQPLMQDTDSGPKLKLPGKGLDFGNYRRGFTMSMGGLMAPAAEMGDTEFVQALQNSLDQDCDPTIDNGGLRYAGSTLANATAFQSRITRRDGFRQTMLDGPPPEALRGPVLTGASYPEVLVAKARSHGDDLELVLYPGKAPGPHHIKVERLKPGRTYRTGGMVGDASVTAGQDGSADLTVILNGRTPVSLWPA